MLKHAFDKGGLISDQTLDLMLTHLSQLSDKATLVVLKYMLNRLEGNAKKAVGRYIELNPDKEDIAMTMMQHLEEKITKKALDEHAPNLIAKGIEKGIEKVARSMLAKNADINFVAETTGLTVVQLEAIKSSLTIH